MINEKKKNTYRRADGVASTSGRGDAVLDKATVEAVPGWETVGGTEDLEDEQEIYQQKKAEKNLSDGQIGR